MRILFLSLSWSRGLEGRTSLKLIVHETTSESRTNQRVMHNVLQSIKRSWTNARARDYVAVITSLQWALQQARDSMFVPADLPTAHYSLRRAAVN